MHFAVVCLLPAAIDEEDGELRQFFAKPRGEATEQAVGTHFG